MNLAAAFGPIEGLSTTINFTNLLGLVTAPGQVANIDVIRTGIDIVDGTIRYQLTGNNHVKVEGGRWPFAGGELLLKETILDFSQPSTKRLTFQVIGLDAAKLVQQLGLESITVTGIFDGVIPMEFDIRGGRIAGGKLDARPQGGTLSYVGEVSEENLGTYGKMAFDALKSLRYSRFYIELDGALTGEFLTRIQLDGLARSPQTGITGGGIRGMIARRVLTQVSRIPFRFNIAIRGPLRAVIGTARAMEDPTQLIQPVLPEAFRDKPTTVTTIETPDPAAPAPAPTPTPPTATPPAPAPNVQKEESEVPQ
jgi:hypothetical protein